jgi:hypothetical protein
VTRRTWRSPHPECPYHADRPGRCTCRELYGRQWSAEDIDIDYATAVDGAEIEKPPNRTISFDLVTVSEVAAEPVRWLWEHRIAFGKLNMLDGLPDVGKSNVSLRVAAAVTTGGTLPIGDGRVRGVPRGDVLSVTVEDAVADSIRPRLEAAGADLSRVHVLRAVTYAGGDEHIPKLPDDLPAIEAAIARTGATLVIIDTLGSHTSARKNSRDDVDMGDVLAALSKMAQDTGTAILAIRHVGKAPAGNAITAGLGSITIIGRFRAGLLAGRDPDDPSKRVLAVVKHNLAPDGTPSLAYRLEGKDVAGAGSVSYLAWDGDSPHTADALIAAGRDHEERDKIADAGTWLTEALSRATDRERLADELVAEAKGIGIAKRTLERAKKECHVSHRRKTFGGPMYWKLPPDPASSRQPRHEPASRALHTKSGEYGVENPPNALRDKGSPYAPRMASMDGEAEGDPEQRPLGLGTLPTDEIPRELEGAVLDVLGRANGADP